MLTEIMTMFQIARNAKMVSEWFGISESDSKKLAKLTTSELDAGCACLAHTSHYPVEERTPLIREARGHFLKAAHLESQPHRIARARMGLAICHISLGCESCARDELAKILDLNREWYDDYLIVYTARVATERHLASGTKAHSEYAIHDTARISALQITIGQLSKNTQWFKRKPSQELISLLEIQTYIHGVLSSQPSEFQKLTEGNMIIQESTNFVHLANQMLLADGHSSPEEIAVLESMADNSTYRYTPVSKLSRVDRSLLIQDLCLLAACDGHFHEREQVLLTQIASELGADQASIASFIDQTNRLSQEIKQDPDKVCTLLRDLPQQTRAQKIAAGSVLGQVAKEVGAKVISTTALKVAGENVEQHIPAKSVIEAGVRVAKGEGVASAVSELGVGALGSALDGAELLSDKIPGTSVVRAGTALLRGKPTEAAMLLAKGVGTKSAKTAAAGTASAVASSFAYAGVSGSLLKVGVALGIASPPTAVIVAPIAAGAATTAAIFVAERQIRKRLSKPKRTK